MSITFLESFDNYQTFATAALGKWQTIINSQNTLSMSLTGGRNATQALQASGVNAVMFSGGNYYQRGITTTTRQIIGIAVKVSQFDTTQQIGFFSWMDGTTAQVTLSVDPFGVLRLKRGTLDGTVLATSASPVIAATGVYYYLELDVTFNGATGAFTLRSNGVQVFTASNQNTSNSGNNQVTGLRMGLMAGGVTGTQTTYIILYDDMYVIDPTVGAQNTSFLGDTRVFVAFPTSDGSPLNFTASPVGSHYLNVNQVEQDGDTTYNFDATAADIDVYGHTATPANTGTIFGVQLCQVSRKDSAAARSTANYLKSAASNTTGATQALSQSYAWYLDIVELDPATGVAFTKTGFDNTQIGVKVAA